ncbi:hypothetical protein HMN09_00482500 [Mycena chlorophos]|uniref:Uncharacterized protein n=1 Tax=Mycena chlorophos TaxID=658473 RepID=A0A8H6TGV9_MYCCL|nr:hypothetical protein HMN09_00482500 [Mycena chlorophos]
MHPIFHLANLDRLPLRPKVQARLVIRGDDLVSSVEKLTQLVRQLPTADAMFLAPLFYDAFNPGRIVVDWDSEATTAQLRKRVSSVLSTLAPFQQFLAYNEAVIPPEAVSELWDRIWEWVKLLEDYWDQISLDTLQVPVSGPLPADSEAGNFKFPPSLSPMPSSIQYYSNLVEVLHIYRKLASYRQSASLWIQNNPRIFGIIAHAWREMLDREAQEHRAQFSESFGHQGTDMMHGIHASAFVLMINGYDLIENDGGPHIQHLLGGVGGTWTHLAAAVVRHLEQTLPTIGSVGVSSWTTERVGAVLNLMSRYKVREDSCDALSQYGVIPALTRLVLAFTNMDPLPHL